MAGMDKLVGAYGQADRQGEWGDCQADLELMARSVDVLQAGDCNGSGSGSHQAEVNADVALAEPGTSVDSGSYVDQVLAGMLDAEWTVRGDVKLVMNWGGVSGSGILEISISSYIVQDDGSLRYGSTQRGVKLVDDKYMPLLEDDGSVPVWMGELFAVGVARERALLYDLVPGVVAKLGDFRVEQVRGDVASGVARGAAVCTASCSVINGA